MLDRVMLLRGVIAMATNGTQFELLLSVLRQVFRISKIVRQYCLKIAGILRATTQLAAAEHHRGYKSGTDQHGLLTCG